MSAAAPAAIRATSSTVTKIRVRPDRDCHAPVSGRAGAGVDDDRHLGPSGSAAARARRCPYRTRMPWWSRVATTRIKDPVFADGGDELPEGVGGAEVVVG
jgi:hypothetical protein